MLGKMVVLKPVVWSPNGYTFPSGIDKRGDDYVAKRGFGHEEWNGDPNRIWNGQRVFHTEVKGRMEDYGRRGDLGMIMTAYADLGPHAVGVATGISLNTAAERSAIAKAVNAGGQARAMWIFPSIRKRFSDFDDFVAFWEKEAGWITWRCPLQQYKWFDKPISLDSAKLFPPTAPGAKPPEIVKMFSMYMAVRPDQAVAIVQNSLDRDSPIIEWLTSGTFDDVPRKTKAYGSPSPAGGSKNNGSAPPATDPYVRYLQSQELTVTPRHNEIQNRFDAHIRKMGASGILADQGGVDIQFRLHGHGQILAEIKPCDRPDARYAVRTAMGQLLDYKQRHSAKKIKLLVVLEIKPSDEDIELAIGNGFGIAYPNGRAFFLKWPA